jgi:hypothetical protein
MESEHPLTAETMAAPAPISTSAGSTPRSSVDSASQPNLFTLVQAAATGASAPADGQMHSARSHRSYSNSQSNTPRSVNGRAGMAKQNKPRGGLTGLPPRKTTLDTPRSTAASTTTSSALPAVQPSAPTGNGSSTHVYKLDMRDDTDNDFDAELAAHLLQHDDDTSEWETEEGETPSFAQLYAAAEAANKPAGSGLAGSSNRTHAAAAAKARKPAEESFSWSIMGVNLLEHFDSTYLMCAGAVLGVCASSIAVLAIKAKLRS